jgi:hypothetical protein
LHVAARVLGIVFARAAILKDSDADGDHAGLPAYPASQRVV